MRAAPAQSEFEVIASADILGSGTQIATIADYDAAADAGDVSRFLTVLRHHAPDADWAYPCQRWGQNAGHDIAIRGEI